LPEELGTSLTSLLNRFAITKTTYVGYEEVFGTVYDQLEYPSILESPLIRDIIVARIAYPESKLALHRWLVRKLGRTYKKDQLYSILDTITHHTERKVLDHTYEKMLALRKEKLHLILFDATTLHFESFKKDALRLCGYSKVSKHNQPQLVLGLMITKEGLPLGYDVYPGNHFDGHTIRSALKRVARRYAVDKVVFVADAGMMSSANIALLEKHGFEFIMAAKIRSMDKETQKKILEYSLHSTHFEFSYHDYRLVISYSAERAKQDEQEREDTIARMKKRLTGKDSITKSALGGIGKSKYLYITGKAEVHLAYEVIQAEKQWDGLKGYLTNVPSEELTTAEVITNYVQLWQVERAFRIAKSDLGIRPIFHYKRKRIRAHILLVFVSLVITRYIEYQLKNISCKRLLENIDGIQSIELSDTAVGVSLSLRPKLSEFMEDVYKKLGIPVENTVKNTLS
jgi:transposase